MARSRMRRLVDLARRTPLHPQWLLGCEPTAATELRGIVSGRVLDIGCADRWVERELQPACQYVGLDHPATGRLMYGARPDLFADAARLPFADASMDVVVMLEVLEHLRFPREALAEAARVLRPGGRLLLSMPFLYPIHDAPHDYQRFTAHGLAREIEAIGLRLERLEPRLTALETAGLIANLALGGVIAQALKQRRPAAALAPLFAPAILAVNLSCWLLGRLLPTWPALTAGYDLTASKP
jgi:SAM-dependent methyltransferase